MPPRLALHLLLHSARLVEAQVRDELAPLGLSHEQARYLDVLLEHAPISITALAHGLGLSQPAATTMVKRLIADRLVAVSADPTDARSSFVSLTQRGVRAAHGAREVWGKIERRLGSGRNETNRLHQTLRVLLDRLGGRPPPLSSEPVARARRNGKKTKGQP
jgi:DNA-binding MarR family transcriptional regulator